VSAAEQSPSPQPPRPAVRLFLCGDVMTGRGVDQVLKHPCDPRLHEAYAHSALDYVRLTETANGPIPRSVGPAYVWGVALDELTRMQPDVRIVNLETSITRCDDYLPKGINYRMSPENADCLTAAGIDCCLLANNHVLDWGYRGLHDTLATLWRLNISTAGAGRNAEDAERPAVLPISGKGRLLIFSFAAVTSGTPRSWAATQHRPGVNLLGSLSESGAAIVREQIERFRQPHDLIVVSVHWGPNWGYDIPDEQRRFAHALIEEAGVSLIHGHSSHHAKAIEIHRNRLVLHGCCDFLNDYEGIQGYENYRDDLALMYFPDVDPTTGDLARLEIVPLQIRRFRLSRPSAKDVDWMRQTLNRESRPFGAAFVPTHEGSLALSPSMTGR